MRPTTGSRPLRHRAAVLCVAAALTACTAALAGSAAADLPQAPGAGVPTPLPSTVQVAGLEIENSFVSSTGWVKPGESYPSRVLVRNPGATDVADVVVRVRDQRGTSLDAARSSAGTVTRSGGTATWSIPVVPAGQTLSLVVESTADTVEEEPTVVWRNVASLASVQVGAGAPVELASHGPKVIPAAGGYETARYGDRPFPVVPVDYADTKHDATHPASTLDEVINDPDNPGSTFNLYQEMSFGQLFPEGTVASLQYEDPDADPVPVGEDDELAFSTIALDQLNTCVGAAPLVDPISGEPTLLYTDRISDDGWYQLPWTRGYYGSDANGSAVVGSLLGVGALQAIDSGCGPTAKLAYDAAVVSDPDIDFNDYDTDKDGVVDFFEVVFEGCGGNGASQLSVAAGCPPEDSGDNVWPHSSSLEFSYTDPETGLPGYRTNDRLTDLEGNQLYYTDSSYTRTTTTETAFPAFVRVGPYNVNPETAIDFASVISHEYGHSLGLPDYYSTGGRNTYGDFTLMATDQSQHMDVIGKKELGWIVPNVLPAGTTDVTGWRDSKRDTGRISWVTADGTPYTLSAADGDYGIHNGEAYVAALPGRVLVDPEKIAQGASGKQLWYSRQGNDFGCPPIGGHNLDIAIPGLADLPEGATVTATFTSFWEIEWDYDYGFVLTGEPQDDGSVRYTSQPSENGYTSTTNPNANQCQTTFGNGITGTPASYATPVQALLDRVAGNYPDGPFVEDEYDISELAGVDGGVLRFSYATDPGLAKLGWLIDDLAVTATLPDGSTRALLATDFEDGDGGPDDPRVYPGGCKEDLSVSGGVCTEGWSYLAAGTPSELEHAYLLEMRDRSGFDLDGRGEADRGGPAFQPGLLLTYTDEAHGYGNAGTDNPPAQSPLDSTPEPECDTPNLADAVFTTDDQVGVAGCGGAPAGDAATSRASFTDDPATPHVDNYSEPTRDQAKDADGDGVQPWTFDHGCLSFTVESLSGNETPVLTAETPEAQREQLRDAFDLVGDVTFTTAGGCAAFNYGFAPAGQVAAPVGGQQPGQAAQPPSAAATAPAPRARTLPATGAPAWAAGAVLLLAAGALTARARRRA